MTDFNTWLLNCGEKRIFRMWELRRAGDWTPREMEEKWRDQSQYVDDDCTYVKIREAIELPDGDILLGLQSICEWEDLNKEDDMISYFKLSQIELMYCPEDMKKENWD